MEEFRDELFDIFVESTEDMGIMYNSYESLLGVTSNFMDVIETGVDKLVKDPDKSDIDISSDITKFKKDIKKNFTPAPIEINKIGSTISKVKKFKKELESLLKRYGALKNKISFGGNYFRAVVAKPKVYSKEINADNYEKINQNIRAVNRGMDWVEKALLDLFNFADQDLNILTVVNTVYGKKHIYESVPNGVILEDDAQIVGMLPGAGNPKMEYAPYEVNTRDKKTGKAPTYIDRNHDMASYGEDEPEEKPKDLEDYRRPSAPKVEPEEDEEIKPYDGEPDHETNPVTKPTVPSTQPSTAEAKAINNYYYNYINSMNRTHDDHSVHTKDDHSMHDSGNNNNQYGKKKEDDFHAVESADMFTLDIGIPEPIMESKVSDKNAIVKLIKSKTPISLKDLEALDGPFDGGDDRKPIDPTVIYLKYPEDEKKLIPIEITEANNIIQDIKNKKEAKNILAQIIEDRIKSGKVATMSIDDLPDWDEPPKDDKVKTESAEDLKAELVELKAFLASLKSMGKDNQAAKLIEIQIKNTEARIDEIENELQSLNEATDVAKDFVDKAFDLAKKYGNDQSLPDSIEAAMKDAKDKLASLIKQEKEILDIPDNTEKLAKIREDIAYYKALLHGYEKGKSMLTEAANNIEVYDKASWYQGDDVQKAIIRMTAILNFFNKLDMLTEEGKEVLAHGLFDDSSIHSIMFNDEANKFLSKYINKMIKYVYNEKNVWWIEDFWKEFQNSLLGEKYGIPDSIKFTINGKSGSSEFTFKARYQTYKDTEITCKLLVDALTNGTLDPKYVNTIAERLEKYIEDSAYEVGEESKLSDDIYVNINTFNVYGTAFYVKDKGHIGFGMEFSLDEEHGVGIDVNLETGKVIIGQNPIAFEHSSWVDYTKESVMTEEVGDADDMKPQSDHPVRDALIDIDRKTTKVQQGVKKGVQDIQNVGRAAMKPVNRAKQWISNMVSNWKDADETKVKERLADPHTRSNLYTALKKCIEIGALFKAGILLNPFFLFLTITRGIGKNKREYRIRNEMIGELKTELQVIDEKIKDADQKGDNKAKYQLMRFKNEINKKLLRVGGEKSWKKII